MNDAQVRAEGPPDEAESHLDRLNGQVSAVRARLVQLLQEVVVAEARLDKGEASLLLKANEQLIVTALDAQTDADTAQSALDEASRVSGLDPLTGLHNRAVLLDRFELAIANAKRHDSRVALLFLDLDAFKLINDTFGHASGDRALQLVADCLSSLVRETDTVSRHGGDEFLVLLAEVTDAGDAAAVAEKVNVALASYSQSDSQPLVLRASIGISVYPEDGEDPRTLIAFADQAMYVAKKQGLAGAGPRSEPSPERATPPAAAHEPGRHRKSRHKAGHFEQEQRQRDLRDANESLVLSALGAMDLLVMVASELSDPHAPIRVAASTLGVPGAEATLLPRVQAVIEEQAERLARMVRQVIEQRCGAITTTSASG